MARWMNKDLDRYNIRFLSPTTEQCGVDAPKQRALLLLLLPDFIHSLVGGGLIATSLETMITY